MAKKENEQTDAISKANIEGLPLLKKEFLKGLMNLRKLEVLKRRLIDLHAKKISTPEESELFEMILKKERLKGNISDANLEILNRIDMSRCTEKCRVIVDNAPRTHYLSKDMICLYYKDYDNDRFVVFVERKIPSEWQMSRELVLKEQRGHAADESEYPKERVLIHRLNLKEKEFKAWFDFEDNLEDLKEASITEEYTF